MSLDALQGRVVTEAGCVTRRTGMQMTVTEYRGGTSLLELCSVNGYSQPAGRVRSMTGHLFSQG